MAFDGFEQPPISYSTTNPTDAVAELQTRLDRDDGTLAFDESTGYLRSVLDLLRIPAEYPQAAPDLISAALLQAENHLRAAGANVEADRLRRERARRGVRLSVLPNTPALSTPPDS